MQQSESKRMEALALLELASCKLHFPLLLHMHFPLCDPMRKHMNRCNIRVEWQLPSHQ